MSRTIRQRVNEQFYHRKYVQKTEFAIKNASVSIVGVGRAMTTANSYRTKIILEQ